MVQVFFICQWCIQISYDVMDVDAPGFEADFHRFREMVQELERRLGALIMQVGITLEPCVRSDA